ncbi:MAG TPA: DinB family protein [Terriglobales bacterium]|nr:DinB family protein [Terriglobales bacterium]
MKRVLLSALLVFLGLTGPTAVAQNTNPSDTDQTHPSYDMKAQALLDLETVQKKVVGLANAVPESKMTWRPSDDTRSFAEVFLHVAAERYGILRMMGAPTPKDFNGKTFEKSTTDKTQIIKELNQSWDFTQQTIKGMSNADFAKLLPKLGPQANAGDVVYILVADAHEHLGQLVAYSRENGIVPPWTVAAKKQAAQKQPEEKKGGMM